MFETLFGGEIPRFFVAFLITFGLIGATAWAVRRFGTARLGGASTRARTREPRLAVVDRASVEGGRQLILVRRDNVEHLLVIGGPTDVVAEANIVRAASAAGEAMLLRPPATAGPLPRAPLQESGFHPLPAPMAALPRPAPRMKPVPDEPAMQCFHPRTPNRPRARRVSRWPRWPKKSWPGPLRWATARWALHHRIRSSHARRRWSLLPRRLPPQLTKASRSWPIASGQRYARRGLPEE